MPRRGRVVAHETRPQTPRVGSTEPPAAARPIAASAAVSSAAAVAGPTRRGLAALAFFFAIGLAATSAIPMLALGQSATAASVTAASVQGDEKLQEWQLSMAAAAPRVTRDGYSSQLVKPAAAAGPVAAGAGDTSGVVAWPFPGGSPISSPFGPRTAPTEGASTFHKGVDFTPGAGTPIHNITAGVVTKVVSNPHDSLGVHLVVDHGTIDGDHVESVYAEMAPGSIQVSMGQKLAVGDIVGKVGISGISTGAHLHYELHLNGTAVDPIAWLKAHVN
jgi:murein DD-endopeptidase MepM/ murein hydrolase activator NlpD